jgi:hypothetical protein
MNTKFCRQCKNNKLISEFHKRGEGLQPECKACRKIRDRDHYAKNKGKIAEQKRAYDGRLRDQHFQLKFGRNCLDCGNVYHPCQMQFDHPPGIEKKGGVADFVRDRSWRRAIEEADKCELVCANCHAMRTHLRRIEKYNIYTGIAKPDNAPHLG